MADDGVDDAGDSEESLLERQRKEKRDLEAQIQKLKHGVPKGDKKKKKEITAQIAVMEAELEAKHEQELKEVEVNANCASAADSLNSLTVNDMQTCAEYATNDAKGKKPSKTQRRREKKAQQEKDRELRILEQESENEFGVRNVEATKLKALLKSRTLTIHEIPSDGNCLYSAVEHQLHRQTITSSVSSLRKQTADHMRLNVDDFLPFLCNPHTGDPYSPDEFTEYCDKLEATPEWGGQLEITALSRALKQKIEVIQADSPSIIVGEEYSAEPLLISYHRHAYKLGEHYNSVVPKSEENESDEEFS